MLFPSWIVPDSWLGAIGRFVTTGLGVGVGVGLGVAVGVGTGVGVDAGGGAASMLKVTLPSLVLYALLTPCEGSLWPPKTA